MLDVSVDPVLPVEIFKPIIDHLGSIHKTRENILPTLNACCLANKTLAALARPHILRAVVFGPFGSRRGSQDGLAHILKKQPHLGSYVEKVRIVLDVNLYPSKEERLQPPPDRNHSITLHEFLPKAKSLTIEHHYCNHSERLQKSCGSSDCAQLAHDILKEFSLIDRLSLDGLVVPMWTLLSRKRRLHKLSLRNCRLSQWNIDESIKYDLVTLPKIQQMQLRNVQNVSPSLLRSFPTVRTFTTWEVEYNTELGSDFLNSCPQPTHISFERLENTIVANVKELGDVCNVMTGTTPGIAVTFPAIRILGAYIDTGDGGIQAANAVFQNIQSLEALHIKIVGSTYETLDLERCFGSCRQSLRTITIVTETAYCVWSEEKDIIEVICDALAIIDGQNVIETLSIRMRWEMYDAVLTMHNTPDFEHWRRFDSIILNSLSTSFPRLKKVDVQVFIDGMEYADMNEINKDGFWLYDNFLREPLIRLHRTSEIEFICVTKHVYNT